MGPVDFDVTDTYITIGSSIGDIHSHKLGLNGCDADIGYGGRVVGVSANFGPCDAIEACLYCKISAIKSWFQACSLCMAYYIATNLKRFFEIQLHPTSSICSL